MGCPRPFVEQWCAKCFGVPLLGPVAEAEWVKAQPACLLACQEEGDGVAEVAKDVAEGDVRQVQQGRVLRALVVRGSGGWVVARGVAGAT